jgi:hypothetical protein
MNRSYRKKLPHLNKQPTEQINGIYIIPDKPYNGFWGKNGYKAYDFIFENNIGKKIGWCHWEGDVIHLMNNMDFGMNIDCECGNEYIRLFTNLGFEISDMMISDLTITTKGRIK